MRAVTFDAYGGPDVLHVADVEEPRPGDGQIRVAIRAAGVNPIDWKARSGMLRDFMPVTLPLIDGREGAGVVEELGSGVTGVAVGDDVFGFTVGGAAAERAGMDEFARKPSGPSWGEGAGPPGAGGAGVRGFRGRR